MSEKKGAYPGTNYYDKENTSIDWVAYSQIVFNERKKIFFITAFFFVTSFIFYALTPNQYDAEVQILVEQMGGMSKLATSSSSNFRGEDDYYGTQVAIITGKQIASKLQEEIKDRAGYKISARRLRGTKIISVGARSTNPEVAASAANKAVALYIQEKVQDDLFIAKQMLKWLPTQAADDVDSTGAAVERDASTATDFAMNMMTQGKGDDPEFLNLKTRRIETQTKITELSARYKPGHPLMRELTEKLAYLDEELKQRKEKDVAGLKQSLEGAFHLTNIKVIASASIPSNPTSPKRKEGITFATILGLVGAILYVLIQEQTDRHVYYDDDLRSVIDVPFMGYIPLISNLAANSNKESKKKGIAPEVQEKLILQTIIRDHPILVDAAALVRTYIMFSIPYERGKILMSTSTTPNEGKSTVIALLALSMAAMGKKVLVIDGDLRRPFLNTNLGVENTVGLADYLAGDAKLENVIRAVPDSTLHMITGGILKTGPTSLLSSPRFKEMMDTLLTQYDRILLDAPPVLYIPDGLIMAKYVQGTILVVGAGMIRMKVLQAVRHKFDLMNRPLVGAIINRADHSMDVKRQRYFKQYQDYYYVGSDGSTTHGKKGNKGNKGNND